MAQGTLKIHSENILPIIKKWLYTDKDIFVRELVSNACDAISKLVILKDQNLASVSSEENFSIDIIIDKEKKTLTFSDNGIGMTAEEVEKYIAQLAFSGAEEFIAKYQTNKTEDQIIGHFGLGFYSAYMVANRVEIQTLSFTTNAKPVLWNCDGSSQYEISEGIRQTRGTDIILHLSPEEEEYLEASKLRPILEKYCAFLPYPIRLNGSLINETPPLWTRSSSEISDKEYIDFYHKLYPYQPEPLFWVHLNVDYPFHLKGILYFPKFDKEVDFKKESIRLFCNKVFVSENCQDLFPEYLTILRGAIDSPDIPLNVSRSSLQMDRTVKQLGGHVSKKISDKLSTLYRTDREKFLSYWEDIELIIKYGVLNDDKFYERAKEFLVFKNSEGAFTTIEEYLERHKEKNGNTVYYAQENQATDPFLALYKDQGFEVVFVRSSMIDTALSHFLEKKLSTHFKRIDSDLNAPLLDPSREKILLDSEGKTERIRIAEFFKARLGTMFEVEAKSLSKDHLPAFLVIKEEERRTREMFSYHRGEKWEGMDQLIKPTFVVNTNNKLIQRIYQLKDKDPSLAEELIHHVYDSTRLAQKELAADQVNKFISRSHEILEKMSEFMEKSHVITTQENEVLS